MSLRTHVPRPSVEAGPRPAADPAPAPWTWRRAGSAALHLPGRVVLRLLLMLLWLYQNLVSPMRAPTCRYYPSCSSYAVGALRRHGAAKGTALAVARVCRCHPWTPGGLDPVPPVGRWRNPPQAQQPVGADPESTS